MALLGISTFLLRTPGLHADFRPATPGSQVSVAGSYHPGFVHTGSFRSAHPSPRTTATDMEGGGGGEAAGEDDHAGQDVFPHPNTYHSRLTTAEGGAMGPWVPGWPIPGV